MIVMINGAMDQNSHSVLLKLIKPHVAGKIPPIDCKTFGSISTGNIIPDSIIDGKKISCDTIVNFVVLFTVKPSIVPIEREAIMKSSSVTKYMKRLEGILASKIKSASINSRMLIRER